MKSAVHKQAVAVVAFAHCSFRDYSPFVSMRSLVVAVVEVVHDWSIDLDALRVYTSPVQSSTPDSEFRDVSARFAFGSSPFPTTESFASAR